MFRWTDGPPHNGVPPVVAIFKDKKDRTEVSLAVLNIICVGNLHLLLSQLYSACREGLKKSGWVVTEDSRSVLNYKKKPAGSSARKND